eukprot:3868_1
MVLSYILSMDFSCLLAILLIVVRDIVDAIITARQFQSSSFSFADMKSFSPEYIQDRFEIWSNNKSFMDFSLMMNAIALFAFFVPLLQVSWILSDGGKRRISSLAVVCVLVLTGAICELIVSLILLGIHGTETWIGNDFNLDNWTDDGDDMIGWRVLELVHTVLRGMTTWINAFEWISIFGIMTTLFIVVQSERSYSHANAGAETFGIKWAILGLVIGILGLFDFVAEILRLQSWRTFASMSFLVRSINMFILVPIYLFILGRQLPVIKGSFEEWNHSDAGKPLSPDENVLGADTS